MLGKKDFTIVGGALLAGALQLGATANAQLTHYVPFEAGYTPGADLNGAGGQDLGFGGNVWFDGAPAGEGSSVVEGSLAANGVDTLGNSATTPTASARILACSLKASAAASSAAAVSAPSSSTSESRIMSRSFSRVTTACADLAPGVAITTSSITRG